VTDHEQNRFEAELRRSRPARLPEDYWSRLLAAARPTKASPVAPWPAPVAVGLQRVLRFFIPAAGVAMAAFFAWRQTLRPNSPPAISPSHASSMAPPASTVKADDLQIAQDLVSSFDTLAWLPGGEPVRFQCRQWMDTVTLSDKTRGLVFEERTPRVEIIPVGFETY